MQQGLTTDPSRMDFAITEVRRLEAENAKLRESLDWLLTMDPEKPTDRGLGRAA